MKQSTVVSMGLGSDLDDQRSEFRVYQLTFLVSKLPYHFPIPTNCYSIGIGFILGVTRPESEDDHSPVLVLRLRSNTAVVHPPKYFKTWTY